MDNFKKIEELKKAVKFGEEVINSQQKKVPFEYTRIIELQKQIIKLLEKKEGEK